MCSTLRNVDFSFTGRRKKRFVRWSCWRILRFPRSVQFKLLRLLRRYSVQLGTSCVANESILAGCAILDYPQKVHGTIAFHFKPSVNFLFIWFLDLQQWLCFWACHWKLCRSRYCTMQKYDQMKDCSCQISLKIISSISHHSIYHSNDAKDNSGTIYLWRWRQLSYWLVQR